MKKGLIIAFTIWSCVTNAQVGVGTVSPHASSALDIGTVDKGFLPPRVPLTGRSDTTTILSPAEGLLVYNTTPTASLNKGVTYFDGIQWYNFSISLSGEQSRRQATASQTISNGVEGLLNYSIPVPQDGSYSLNLRTFYETSGYTGGEVSFYHILKVNGTTQDVLEIYQPGITSYIAENITLYYSANVGDTVELYVLPALGGMDFEILTAFLGRNNINIVKNN